LERREPIKLRLSLPAFATQIAIVSIILLAVLLTIPTIFFRYKIGLNPFWDTDVYVRAIKALRTGLDPYYFDDSVQIYSAYPYHPYVLGFMVTLDRLIFFPFWLTLGYTMSLSFFIRELFLSYSGQEIANSENFPRIKFGIFLIIIGLIGGSSVIGVASGNISIFLHFTLVAVALRSIRLNKSLGSLAAFSIASAIVKPYFLTYLLIVLIYSKTKRRGMILCFSSILTWSVIYFSASVLNSQTFDHYLAAVRYVTSGIQDWGYSFFGILRRRLGDEVALLVHLAILSTSVAVPLYLRFVRNCTPTQMASFFPSICYFVVCLNPRMKEYDFGVLIFVSLSSLYLFNRKLAYFSIFGCSILLLIRQLLLWLDANLIDYFPGNFLYLKYWEVLMAGLLVLLSTVINYASYSLKSNTLATYLKSLRSTKDFR
jgi:hypothetical protein